MVLKSELSLWLYFLSTPSPNSQLMCIYYVCQVWTVKENADDNEERCFILGCRIMIGFYDRSIPEERLESQYKEIEFDHGLILFLIFVCNTHVSLPVFSIYTMFPSTGSRSVFFTYHKKVEVQVLPQFFR